MTDLTNILYWISTGLLVPVIVILLIAFVKSLIMTGGFVGMYINRLKFSKKLNDFVSELKKSKKNNMDEPARFKENRLFSSHLAALLEEGSDKLVAEKILQDFEASCEKDLAVSKSLSRLGPMLGLMGTLIPMGPALVGLAAGDIATMAQNMQVAFSTTVVGLLVGAIGYVVHLIKHRWYIEDMNNLEFIYSLVRGEL